MEMLRCNHCGAGLPVAPTDTAVGCVFCGHQQPVPAAVQARATAVAAARQTEGEAWRALEAAVAERLKPGPVALMSAGLAALMTFVGVIVVALQIYFRLQTGVGTLHALMVLAVTAVFVALVGVLMAAGFRAQRQRRSRALDQLRATSQGQPTGSQCPNCGGQVQVPHLTDQVTCAFCREPLLVSHGMIVQARLDAAQRAQAWQAQARAQVERTKVWREAQGCLAMALYPSMSFAGVLFLGLTVFFARSALRLEGVDSAVAPGTLVKLLAERQTGQWELGVVAESEYSDWELKTRHQLVVATGRVVERDYGELVMTHQLREGDGAHGVRARFSGQIQRLRGPAVLLVDSRGTQRWSTIYDLRLYASGVGKPPYRLQPLGLDEPLSQPGAAAFYRADDGHQYPATVVEPLGPKRYRAVLFTGETVEAPPERLTRGKLKTGQEGEVRVGSSRWKKAKIVATVGLAIRVKWSDGTKTWASAQDFRLPGGG